ncbi:hypothetical protein BN2475_450087 [Paraburkholderia ribeironis]|uniref:Uncharacterized protein n=1 Tax=Paraburkholderia ribeironis TaxID=1247936 RepID=A0A1N7S8W7_9BURK|nr:hypothetical protein BN2475_450087 [Paraburkholderia ribeironis]
MPHCRPPALDGAHDMAAQPVRQLKVQPDESDVSGGATWTLERCCGALRPVCSPGSFSLASVVATRSADRPCQNGQGHTHRILSLTMFRIEHSDAGDAPGASSRCAFIEPHVVPDG